ncbi:hypothetical protein FA95DRAFT_1574986 [Auriscalpium vulgare]|uniref:Uncharacterized protein n=1 Tax=Auriscalpium vulgare TaxID=40419 RepID=A0ACB8RIA8_9AGAM|nr:hypothetical protein FA95DRAFT_1574986 [Auriscalpium vulgare]
MHFSLMPSIWHAVDQLRAATTRLAQSKTATNCVELPDEESFRSSQDIEKEEQANQLYLLAEFVSLESSPSRSAHLVAPIWNNALRGRLSPLPEFKATGTFTFASHLFPTSSSTCVDSRSEMFLCPELNIVLPRHCLWCREVSGQEKINAEHLHVRFSYNGYTEFGRIMHYFGQDEQHAVFTALLYSRPCFVFLKIPLEHCAPSTLPTDIVFAPIIELPETDTIESHHIIIECPELPDSSSPGSPPKPTPLVVDALVDLFRGLEDPYGEFNSPVTRNAAVFGLSCRVRAMKTKAGVVCFRLFLWRVCRVTRLAQYLGETGAHDKKTEEKE